MDISQLPHSGDIITEIFFFVLFQELHKIPLLPPERVQLYENTALKGELVERGITVFTELEDLGFNTRHHSFIINHQLPSRG